MGSQRIAPYIFLAPFLAVFGVFIFWPLLQSLALSLQRSFGPGNSEFVGLVNFSILFQDPLFWKATKNTAIFAAGSLLFQMPLALGLALVLNQPWIRGRSWFRLIFFIPSLLGFVFVAILFSLVFEKRTGLLNVTLHSLFGFGLEIPWLQEYVMASLIIAALWMYVGYNMIYFLAALQSVDQELVEAARIDGANVWHQFLNVTLPAIRPVAYFVVLLSMIGSFQLFELPYLMFRETPGPDNQGLTIVMYLYQQGFQVGDLGYASAVGWVLALFLISVTLIQRKLSADETP